MTEQTIARYILYYVDSDGHSDGQSTVYHSTVYHIPLRRCLECVGNHSQKIAQ